MKKVVSFSGGRTSAYMCYVMIAKFGRKNLEFIYLDTGMEHPKTYDFIRKVDAELKLNLVCLKAVIDPELGKGMKPKRIIATQLKHDLTLFKEFVTKHGVPYYPNGAQCTAGLKTDMFNKYCDNKYGKGNYEAWLGIRADEPRRLNRKAKNRSYLADISDFDKGDVLDFWVNQNYDLEIDEWSGNCLFCIHKKWSKLALVAMENPVEAAEFIDIVDNFAKDKGKGEVSRVAMYQGGQSLKTVIKMFSNDDYEAIKESVIRGKRTDTGSCSESCEVFK